MEKVEVKEQKTDEWECVEPGVWKPQKEGDCISGVVVQKREGVGVNESKAYYISTAEGTFMVWGCTVLDDRMAFVKEGDVVRITFKGQERNKKNQPVNIYKVEKRREQSLQE